ncbi:MAG: glucan endo-1,6-beta-glucosidase [Cohnella sp.]|uniref:glycoside hydrolase family 30 protein n=1 Tax=Cohnella sp. TaxID=1883426 RepID=UPI000E3729B4|nr:glycoside hydrolase family 30 beta sandwich domain-containing protein [Cohnella sp.]REK65039.1 MAG: glucan endo-1,6-beta-glucosidase [Cohnella sp.]
MFLKAKSKSKRSVYFWGCSLLVLALFLFPLLGRLTEVDAAGETVNVWVTTGDQSKLLQKQSDVSFGADSGTYATTVNVNENTTYQTIKGFGAAVTGSSAYLINQKMSASQRSALLNDLFGAGGIGLSYIRHTIGASDFSLSSYTYNDTPNNIDDFDLNYFSINPDKTDVIPTLKSILSVNSGIKILGSPWSAPAWMKDTETLNGSYLKWYDSRYYTAYANYFVKYINAFKAEGVPIDAITVQNEPLHTTSGYPSMSMSDTEQRDFIKNYLGPAFRSNNIPAKIVVYDHNWDQTYYATNIFADAAASQYIDGSAWHCYAGNPSAMTTVHNAYPSKNIYFTECSGGEWATNFGDNLKWNLSNLIIGATRNWAQTVLLWNLALDPNHGPTNGGCADCRGVVTINPSNGNVTKNVEYYVLGHASKFVKPGAVRIDSNTYSGGIENVAFKNPDGSKVLIALNNSASGITFKVRWASQAFVYTLPAGAAATFTWSGSGSGGGNLLQNPGFETGSLSAWSSWTPDGQAAAHKVDSDNPRSGSYKLVHWASGAYQQTTYQAVSVPNGTYKATVWVRSGGGQNTLRLEASNYGGGTLYGNIGSAAVDAWTPYTIDNINVTTGTITIGVYSNANAGNWAVFDDFELVRK